MNEQMQCMEVWGGNHGEDRHLHMPGLDVWLYSRPIDNAANGGDVFYLSSCASGRISRLLIADLSGHGPSASHLALKLRDLMRRNINRISQERFVKGVNEEFTAFNQDGRFATALAGTFFACTGSLQLCTAGHPDPILYRHSTRTWEILEAGRDFAMKGNIPLGIQAGVAYGQTQIKISPGDMILAYTDGLTESRVADGKLLATSGLLNLVRSLDPSEPNRFLPSLLAHLHDQRTAPLGDDLTMMLARANGSQVSPRDNLLAPFRLLRGVRDSTRFRDLTEDFSTSNRRLKAPSAVTLEHNDLVGIADSGGRMGSAETQTVAMPRIEWLRCLPFLLLHVACIAVFWVGWSWTAVAIALVTLFLRVFGLTGFYHRYFSHRAFKTSRWFQFVGAVLGSASVQRGPLWWAAHHRSHHHEADTARDPHSPVQHGFFWSHMAWFMTSKHFGTNERLVRDWSKYPELRFLNRYEIVVPLCFALALFGLGEGMGILAPSLGTSGWQVLVWGFFLSTVALHHLTFSVNSFAHRFGTRTFPTKDESRNNFVLALLTFGEGWHNNHHHYPTSARQGFRWWQIDITYYLLVLLSWIGLVWDLKPVPRHLRVSPGRPVAASVPAGTGS